MDLIDDHLDWLSYSKGLANSSINKYQQNLRRLEAFLISKEASITTATQQLLEEFTGLYAHKELKLKPNARKPIISAIRGLYKWAFKNGHINNDPAKALDHPKAGLRLPRAMPLHHAETLLMQPDLNTFLGVRDAAMLGVLIGCGPRVAGLCSLNQEDLIWLKEKGRESLVIRFVEKGNKERLVPAPPETTMLIHAYLGHEDLDEIDRVTETGEHVLFVSTNNHNVPEHEYRGENRRLSTKGVDELIKKYGEGTNIPPELLHAHALRHLFGAEMAENDIGLLIHQGLMGHADPKTTELYSHIANRKKAEAILKASPMRNIRTPVSDLVRHLEQQDSKRPSGPPSGS